MFCYYKWALEVLCPASKDVILLGSTEVLLLNKYFYRNNAKNASAIFIGTSFLHGLFLGRYTMG